jgi:hypothetical protein
VTPRAHGVQVIRTIAEGMYEHFPYGDLTILESYVPALHSAQRLIYLENQVPWAPKIVEIVADKLHNPPHRDRRVCTPATADASKGLGSSRAHRWHATDQADSRAA